MAVTPIHTERLTLRGWRADDFEAYAAFYDDEENARFVGGRRDAEKAWRSLALLVGHWELRGFGYFAVEETATGAFVGAVGIWKSPGWPETELAYWLVRAQQGKGFALEACRRCLEHARETLRVPSLVSYVAPENRASIRVATKLGATLEGTIELCDHGPHGVWRHW